jgi:predicted O-linked N-acetylglucosamine transferase (SPINDLY family)
MSAQTPPNFVKTPGRNDPCPCGSGKKYKKCCMGKLEPREDYSRNLNIEQKLVEAASLFESGQLDAAKNIASEILSVAPTNADANHILGSTEMALGNLDQAETLLLKAARHAKNNAYIQLNLAKLYEMKKEFDTALSFIARSEKLDPELADSQYIFGNLLLKIGEAEKAIPHYKKAIKLEPSNPDYLLGYYAGLHHSHRIDEARNGYHELIAMYPTYISSYINLAAIYRDQGDLGQGVKLLQKAIQLQPANAELYSNLGSLYGGMGEIEKEAKLYKQALSLNPKMFKIYHNLMGALKELKKFEELYDKARKILITPELQPLLGEALGVFGDLAAFDERRAAFEVQLEEYKNSIGKPASMPNFLMTNDLDNLDAEVIYFLHRSWGKLLESEVSRFNHNKERCGSRRIRIGYVSPDFRAHSVGFFIRNILKHSDTNFFEVYCYSSCEKEDEITKEIRKSVTGFMKVRLLSHKEVAEQIYKDQIDILVDLAGHTEGSRVAAFAYKPAPVQITYLGYPNTTGLKAIDYRISDHYADVEDGTKYSEKLICLPESFISFGAFSEEPIADKFSFETFNYITFGSFNNIRKLNRATIETWSSILLRTPGSRLIIKSGGLDQKIVQKNMSSLFAEYGVASDRFELLGMVADRNSHLAAYNRIDIALDTFPYNGTTTTCEALWMGVPVVTLLGEKHAQRVSYSILKNIGVENTIAYDREQYIDLAVQLANNPEELRHLKKSLREKLRHSILCDSSRFTGQLEDLYRKVWEGYCAH